MSYTDDVDSDEDSIIPRKRANNHSSPVTPQKKKIRTNDELPGKKIRASKRRDRNWSSDEDSEQDDFDDLIIPRKSVKSPRTPRTEPIKRTARNTLLTTPPSPSRDRHGHGHDHGSKRSSIRAFGSKTPLVPLPRTSSSIAGSPSGRKVPELLSYRETQLRSKPNVRTGQLSPRRRSPTKRNVELVRPTMTKRSRSVPASMASVLSPSRLTSPGKRRKKQIDSIGEGSPGRKLFSNFLRSQSQSLSPSKALPLSQPQSPARQDKSAKKKAVRNLLENGFDDLSEDIISSSSPRKNLFQILDDQGSKALFLDGPEGYFEQHKSREKIGTSRFDDVPDLPYTELKEHVAEQAKGWANQRYSLRRQHEKLYSQWFFELTMGYSLMFYGVGSKLDLLNDFVTTMIDHPVLVVNGYNPDTTTKDIMNDVVEELLTKPQINKLPKQPADMANALIQKQDLFMKHNKELTVLIHNIDGEALRSDKDQVVLSRLAMLPNIHIIASIDHVYAPLMWDPVKVAAYKFVWHNVTTYEKYSVETSFDNQLTKGKESEAQGVKGAQYVLASLTENSKKLYNLLLCHQMETMMEETNDDSEDQGDATLVATVAHGMEFKTLYSQCVEEFIVSNELNFRTMLTEFIEHQMIKSHKDASGSETLYIPLTREAIESMIEELS